MRRNILAAATLIVATLGAALPAADTWTQWRGGVATGQETAAGDDICRVQGLNPQHAPGYRLIASPVVWKGIEIAPARVQPLPSHAPQKALDDYCLSSAAVSEGHIVLRTSEPLWVIGDRKK